MNPGGKTASGLQVELDLASVYRQGEAFVRWLNVPLWYVGYC